MFETLFILFVGVTATATVNRSHSKARRNLAKELAEGYVPKPQVHSVVTKETWARHNRLFRGTKKRNRA